MKSVTPYRQGVDLLTAAFVAFDLAPAEAARCARVIASRPKAAALFSAGLGLLHLHEKGRRKPRRT